jgi:hypothetical protein
MAFSSPVNFDLRNQIASLHAQLDVVLKTYSAQRSSASLLAALKIQTKIAGILLNSTALATPTSTAQAVRIGALS